ncbi:14496_t:CDS:1, partial [Gigaspora margarita]
ESEASSIKKKLKEIVGLFIQKLKNKETTASQMVYINNQILLPKLEYMLQATVCSETELKRIHQPFLRLLKRKLGIVPNSLLVHRGVFRVKLLANILIARQATTLLKQSNGYNNLEKLIELRIIQGALDAG